MAEVFREVETWGTVIAYRAKSEVVSESILNQAADEVREFLFHVDETFSTYKESSVISQLRKGKIDINDCSDEVRGVWNANAYAKELTFGLFDPWCVEGGYDPSGYVKGWAADRATEIFAKHGVTECVVNAGGDLSIRSETPQVMGVSNPFNHSEVVHTFNMACGALAMSGVTEKGAHIRDPYTGLIAIGATAAAVWGPDGGIAEALATALIVSGKDGAKLFGQPELSEYHCYVIDRGEDKAWII